MISRSRWSMFRYRLLARGRGLGSLIVGSTVILFSMVSGFTTPCQTTATAAERIFSVGHLAAGGRMPDGAPPGALREVLRGLGYFEGKTIAYEARFAEGAVERLPGLAAELVGRKVDVIVAQGGAARRATSTIPIVMAVSAGDAVARGWITSLARPGGNITGLTDETVQLSAKRLQLLKEAVPQAALIAVLWNDTDPGMTLRYREIEKAARSLKIEVQALGVREPTDFAATFSAMTRRRPDALFLVADVLTSMNGSWAPFGRLALSEPVPGGRTHVPVAVADSPPQTCGP